jgi:hypothetical protein
VRAALYAGALGALYASGDFALASQLSGDAVTIPTSAYAEAVTLGTVGDETLASLTWAVITLPLFLYFLRQLLTMVATTGSAVEQAPAEPVAPAG